MPKGSSAASKKKKKASNAATRPGPRLVDHRHDARRSNNPSGGDADIDWLPRKPKSYDYDPHLDPALNWAGKAERPTASVDTVSLHIHQYISALDILRAVQREDVQGKLWPELPATKEIEFYAHEVGWANRMIIGDSLTVMNSLLEREQLAGKVQCIYVDPPYGVKFNSNFQPSISKREVKDGDDASLTREPEQIQAYRDTWELGVHSYLTYLRDRLALARSLLSDSGSIFVQISDENIHHVRELMDEIFGASNFVSVITFTKTGGASSSLLGTVSDFIVWYAKSKPEVKYHQLYLPKHPGEEGATGYVLAESPDRSSWRPMTKEERANPKALASKGWRIFDGTPLCSSGATETGSGPFEFEGETFHPPPGSHWKTHNPVGMRRLADSGRIIKIGNRIEYKRYIDDFSVTPISNLWTGMGERGFVGEKLYVVQTAREVIQRCILMTTDPGELVLDPTCGSGTTADVAEEWGRRWITCDTSRVAIALARQRLLCGRFPYYRLRSERVRDGFVYRTIPHIMLGGIANNARLDSCKNREERESVIRQGAEQTVLYDQPEQDSKRVRVSGPFTIEAIPVAAVDRTPEEDDEAAGTQQSVVPASRIANGPADYITMMIDLVRKTGVRFPNRKHLAIPTLRSLRSPHEYLHAEGEINGDGRERRVAISFGSQHAPVTPFQVRDAIDKSRGYDIVLFIGFGCDPQARRMMEAARGRELHFVHAAPDILVNDLLKTKKSSTLFTAFGSPDVRIRRQRDKQVIVELAGVDLYDPVTGTTSHSSGHDVAAWFVDQNYDNRTFCINQALFPARSIKDPWQKLQKALKGTIDEATFATLRGTQSLPFKPGRRVAVNVIDDRGNEVLTVVDAKED